MKTLSVNDFERRKHAANVFRGSSFSIDIAPSAFYGKLRLNNRIKRLFRRRGVETVAPQPPLKTGQFYDRKRIYSAVLFTRAGREFRRAVLRQSAGSNRSRRTTARTSGFVGIRRG